MKKLLIALTLILSISTPRAAAQQIKDDYTFQLKQIVAPATLIALGTTSLYINNINNMDLSIRDYAQYGHPRATFDDYLQYAPVAMMWTLDACGVESRHQFREQTTTLAIAGLTTAAIVAAGKYTIRRPRPVGHHNSMPSGHTATAFACAEFVRLEYKDNLPWVGYLSYAMATTTGLMRVYNDRHWFSDVVAGAGVGILSVKIAYWLAPKVNKLLWGSDIRNKDYYTVVSPYAFGDNYGLGLTMQF